MKSGANLHEIKLIKQMHQDGIAVDYISTQLGIEKESVQSFVDLFIAPPTTRKEVKKKKPNKSE